MKTLKDIAFYPSERINVDKVADNYISTENMNANKCGVTFNGILPNAKSVVKYSPNDILVSNIRPYFKKIWQADRIGGCSNDVLVLRSKEDVNANYLYYVLAQDSFFDHMMSGANGTKMPRGNKGLILDFSVPGHSLQIQQKIASILSRYDNLIANYRQQIKLLEEATQRIYKEWFVDMRFPGHETAKFGEDGLPEDWSLLPLGTLGEFKRGKTITKSDVTDGAVPVVAGGLEPAYYHNKANTSGRVITVSGSGANAGFTRMYYQEIWASDCSFLDTKMTEYLHFVYCALKLNKTYINNLQKGAAQPHVYAKDINAMKVCIPHKTALEVFEQKVKPLFDIIGNLNVQICSLSEARDRLLPRLMSGEIAV